MESNKLKNKHLMSWRNELLKKINLKKEEIREMTSEIEQIDEINKSKKSEILSLEKIMENTVNNVEKYIKEYSSGIVTQIEKINELEHKTIEDKSKVLFSLYKKMYNDACIFFSRKEFKYVPSSLKMNMNDTFLNWLQSFLEDENYDGWTDILTPIWSIEKQYNDMEKKYTILTKSFNIASEKYKEKKKTYNTLLHDVENMKKEIEALQEFSDKIKKCQNNTKEDILVNNVVNNDIVEESILQNNTIEYIKDEDTIEETSELDSNKLSEDINNKNIIITKDNKTIEPIKNEFIVNNNYVDKDDLEYYSTSGVNINDNEKNNEENNITSTKNDNTYSNKKNKKKKNRTYSK